jgi:hypothetical protein
MPKHKLHPATQVLFYKRQAMVIAGMLSVFALIALSGNISLTPATAAHLGQPSAQPTSTAPPILLTDPIPDPKQAGVQHFPQTGHTLRGAFLDYWQRYGGLEQFGYPLTEEFFEPVGKDNRMHQVQYFERNRFELHPEDKGTQFEVLLGALGRDFRQQDLPASPIAGATYFQETGHNLSGTFKQYWDTHGGLFVHGFPITEPQMERGTNGKEYLVQWFERSRFEMHPENAGTPYEVLLGLLGRQLSEKKGYPYGWYPLYGHAPDYSWIAGRYEMDFRLCPNCGCDNIHYAYPVDRLADRYKKGVRIRPYGPEMFDIPLLGLDPSRLLVVFGRLDKPIESELEGTETCEKPGYFVERMHTNPR